MKSVDFLVFVVKGGFYGDFAGDRVDFDVVVGSDGEMNFWEFEIWGDCRYLDFYRFAGSSVF